MKALAATSVQLVAASQPRAMPPLSGKLKEPHPQQTRVVPETGAKEFVLPSLSAGGFGFSNECDGTLLAGKMMSTKKAWEGVATPRSLKTVLVLPIRGEIFLLDDLLFLRFWQHLR